MELSSTDMAAAVGLNYRAFKSLDIKPLREEIRGKNKTHVYLLSDVIAAMIKAEKERSKITTETGEELDKEQEEALYIRTRREAQELKNQRIRGDAAPVEALEHALSSVITALSSRLSSIPLNIKRKHPETPTSIIRYIEEELAEAQNDMVSTQVDWGEEE